MEDEILKELRSKVDLAAVNHSRTHRWKAICIDVLFVGMVLTSLIGLTYVVIHY